MLRRADFNCHNKEVELILTIHHGKFVIIVRSDIDCIEFNNIKTLELIDGRPDNRVINSPIAPQPELVIPKVSKKEIINDKWADL